MLITGLVVVLVAAMSNATQPPNIDSSEIEINNEYNNFDNVVDDKQQQMRNSNGAEQISVNDQISLLTKQLKALTEQRQEDYRMLERSLFTYVDKKLIDMANVDIKRELKDLR